MTSRLGTGMSLTFFYGIGSHSTNITVYVAGLPETVTDDFTEKREFIGYLAVANLTCAVTIVTDNVCRLFFWPSSRHQSFFIWRDQTTALTNYTIRQFKTSPSIPGFLIKREL